MSSSQTTPSRRTATLLFAGVAVLAFVLDQATKRWVETSMTLGEQIDVLPPVLFWRYHLNPGAAFSIGTDHTWIFTLVQLAVLCLALWYARRLGGSWLWALGLGGLAGGVTGNLTDRLLRPPSLVEGRLEQFGQGHVVDFISVPHFAIFNIADSFIVCSIIGLCALMLFGVGMDGRRHTAEQKEAE
ncbi:signal peptidase II [Nesterenkonia sp.]|uniref:signal peptidase II n=1 Tax=Nesterenkonia sp. TaxID=704201 RepID=UPI002608CC3A|nr:signal peptidase II [Nesterenkonia sp.]